MVPSILSFGGRSGWHVTAHRPLGLLAQSRLQAEATQILGAPVDIVFDHAIRPDVRDRIVNEAVLL